MSVKILQPLTPIHVQDGAAASNFTTFQDISPAPSLLIPQQDLEAGLEVSIEAWGEFSNTGTPTLQIGFWFNTASTVLAANALTTTVTGATSWPWWARYRGRLRSVGPGSTGGSWNGMGEVAVGGALDAWQSGFPKPIPITLAARTVACDVTAARNIGVGAAWGTANASNSIKVNGLSVVLYTGL